MSRLMIEELGEPDPHPLFTCLLKLCGGTIEGVIDLFMDVEADIEAWEERGIEPWWAEELGVTKEWLAQQ